MDPYKVLGVSPDADEETIKKAYRALVKKYHPDKYVNTPMAEVASEKMKEINEAYDLITNNNTSSSGYSPNGGYGGYSGYGGYGGYRGYTGYENYSVASFENVRSLIAQRRFYEAENMLMKLPQSAEWYYLYGLIYMNRGRYHDGMEYINKAISMDPDNQEYRSTKNAYDNTTSDYRKTVYTSGGIPCGLCSSLCLSYICCSCNRTCTDCCCSC